MAQPKWQRARVVHNPHFPADDGMMFWVSIRENDYPNAINIDTGEPMPDPIDLSRTNLSWQGHVFGYQANMVELLPEFADDVPLMSWEEFLKEHANG